MPPAFIVIGNFGTMASLRALTLYINLRSNCSIDGVKVGIGPGSACTTRIKTGCGVPQLSAIQEIAAGYKGLIIADGGCRSPGDIAKALAAGAHIVMLGGMLAGTAETPGETIQYDSEIYKFYRGSASKEAYLDQGKTQGYITAEGESFTVLYKGPVENVLADIEGGLRSALTYVGASDLDEFRAKAKLIRITSAGVRENYAHGKED
jgi:IMP dehydrogenase